eukprot:TRINITY_DN4972_c0_g1_i1.p1 TRINITY_DN4972_c0_g1~~TRINITY_DN4972_c0_g1_i1.p1  ORF type:complete len:415 (+),score=124.03 TRINITY_DN4972_c0_g1_i1:82-1326(+)
MPIARAVRVVLSAFVLCLTVEVSLGETCRCRACLNPPDDPSALDASLPNTERLLAASDLSDLPRGQSGVHLAAHRGTTSNKKKGRQRPLFMFMCERRPLPGYPHTISPPKDMRTPKVLATNPHGLAFGALFKTATPVREAIRKRCLRTRNSSVAVFLGDSITFGALVQSRMQWAVPIDVNDESQKTLTNESFNGLSVFWRVAIQALEGRIPSKRSELPATGGWWYRRSYPIGRGGITAGEFNEFYSDMVIKFLDGTRAGTVTMVHYFLGTNDMLLAGMGNTSAFEGFRLSSRKMLSEIRRRYDGPLVLGTVPFATDPGRTSSEWLARKVWWNWAVDDINAEVRTLANDFNAGIADYHHAMEKWRKHLPQLDGVHPAWWAHKALAQELLKGMVQAVERLPHDSSVLAPNTSHCVD